MWLDTYMDEVSLTTKTEELEGWERERWGESVKKLLDIFLMETERRQSKKVWNEHNTKGKK